MNPPNKRKRVRLKIRFMEVVKDDLKVVGLTEKDKMD